MIATDMENDAKNFDGKPFTGKTVAQYFGKHGAAIAALANIMKKILSNEEPDNNCVHPRGYIKSIRVCGLCGKQV